MNILANSQDILRNWKTHTHTHIRKSRPPTPGPRILGKTYIRIFVCLLEARSKPRSLGTFNDWEGVNSARDVLCAFIVFRHPVARFGRNEVEMNLNALLNLSEQPRTWKPAEKTGQWIATGHFVRTCWWKFSQNSQDIMYPPLIQRYL